MNKKISTPIAIGIIIVLAVLVGGIVLWQYLAMPRDEEISKVKVAPEEILPSDETADWMVYRNEEYGFEIKYPFYESQFSLLEEWINYRPAFDMNREENLQAIKNSTIIGGENRRILGNRGGPWDLGEGYTFIEGGRIYQFRTGSYSGSQFEKDKIIFHKILSTFRFLE